MEEAFTPAEIQMHQTVIRTMCPCAKCKGMGYEGLAEYLVGRSPKNGIHICSACKGVGVLFDDTLIKIGES